MKEKGVNDKYIDLDVYIDRVVEYRPKKLYKLFIEYCTENHHR